MPCWSFPKTSLRQRLSLGLSTMLVPLLMLAGGALISFEGALDSFQKQDNVSRQALFPLADVEGLILELSIVASPSKATNAMTLAEYQRRRQAVQYNLTMLLEFSQGKPTQYHSVRELQRKWQQIADLCQQILDTTEPDRVDRAEAKAQLTQRLKVILQDIQQLNYRLIAFQNDANLEHAEFVRGQVRLLVAIISVLALVLAILCAYGLSQSITVPLRALEEGVEQLGKGDLSQRICLETEDEFSHLAAMFNLMATQLEQSQRDLARLATLDGLTEVYNRREFNRWLMVEIERSQRHTQLLSLIMVDIDHFKPLNDTYGHQAGDLALCEVAQLLQREVRPNDIVCRYGGEEFAILLPNTTSTESQTIAERIRLAIATQPITLLSLQQISLTASLGVATFPEDAKTKEHLIKQADQALYAAKHSGRNRVHQARRKDFETGSVPV